MELSKKEQIIALAALNEYMSNIERKLKSGELDEDEYADAANDAALLEILIGRLEEALGKQT